MTAPNGGTRLLQDLGLDEYIAAGLSPQMWAAICERYVGQAPVALNGATPADAIEDADEFIDWPTFWAKERTPAEWLVEPILARGRGHAIYAKHKTGKSLVMLWMAAQLSQHDDVVVIYLDYEMGEEDLDERLTDLGYGPESDLSRLRYDVIPSLPPLDQPEGGAALLHLVDVEQRAHPDAHIVVVIDTIGRAVVGDENEANTFRAFHRSTGMGLKRRGVTWARLDNAGHDDAHQRGSSSKGDDPDVIWLIKKAEDGGLTFVRDAARMSWVPAKVAVVQLRAPLRFVPGIAPAPVGTKELADLLDELGAPWDASVRAARSVLKKAKRQATQEVLTAAVRYRKEQREQP